MAALSRFLFQNALKAIEDNPIVERLSSAVSTQTQAALKAIEDNRSTLGTTGEACDAQRSEAVRKAWPHQPSMRAQNTEN